MDREISKEQQKQELRKKQLRYGGIALAVVAAILILVWTLGKSHPAGDFSFAQADRGTIESSVKASGKIVPLYEQTIVSPVATTIIEVYRNEGDSVGAGESLLRLDLQETETEYQRMVDEASMKDNEIRQTALNNATYITDLEMRIRAKEMSVSHLKAEVANEQRLDCIGSGTGDRIREAQLAYETGKLELEQLRMQLDNERKAHDMAYRSKQLEGEISRRNLQTMQRTLDDARVKA